MVVSVCLAFLGVRHPRCSCRFSSAPRQSRTDRREVGSLLLLGLFFNAAVEQIYSFVQCSLFFMNIVMSSHKSNFHFVDEHVVARRAWQLIDRVVQQIVLQQEDGGDPDVAPLDINVNYILDTWVAMSKRMISGGGLNLFWKVPQNYVILYFCIVAV